MSAWDEYSISIKCANLSIPGWLKWKTIHAHCIYGIPRYPEKTPTSLNNKYDNPNRLYMPHKYHRHTNVLVPLLVAADDRPELPAIHMPAG